MALMVHLPSACGRTFVKHDYFDDNFATVGSCCNECQSILISRLAFTDADGNYIPDAPHITRLSRTPDNDPWYVR